MFTSSIMSTLLMVANVHPEHAPQWLVAEFKATLNHEHLDFYLHSLEEEEKELLKNYSSFEVNFDRAIKNVRFKKKNLNAWKSVS